LNKNLEVREKTMARLLADGKIEAREGKNDKKIWVGNHFGFTDIW
jgi:hypothetical protein